MTVATEIHEHFTQIRRNGISTVDLDDLIAKYPKAHLEELEDELYMVTFPDNSKLGLDLRIALNGTITFWLPKSQLS